MNIEGKVIHFLGDSITEGVGATDASHCFVSLIGRKTGAVVHNYGVGGTRIARQLNCPQDEGKDFCARFIEMEQGADMIIVFGGTNDYGHGNAPFGSFEDKTPDTFKAAFLLPLKGGFTCVQKMLLQQVGEPFPVIFERLVKVGKVMSPRPVITAVSRFGQIADGNVGAGIVFPHEQGEVALVRSVKVYDG